MNRNIPLRSHGRRNYTALFTVVIAAHLGLPEKLTANKTWTAGSGNWSVPGNWTPSGVPSGGDAVFLTQNDSTHRVVTYDDAFNLIPLANVVISASGTGTILLSQNLFALNSTNMALGTSGRGVYTKTAGNLNITTLNFATAANGAGTFNHLGGTSTIQTINLGTFRAGTINLSGGTINATTVQMSSGAGSSGHVEHTGGLFSVSGTLTVGSASGGTATYSISNGTLSGGTLLIQSGGVFHGIAEGRTSFDTARLTTGGRLLIHSGPFRAGHFTHDGGTLESDYFVNGPDRFTYNSGSFLGQLDSMGTVTLNADLTLGNGWENRTLHPINGVPAGRTVTANGFGFLQSSGNFTLNGTLNSTISRVGGLTAGSTSEFTHQSGLHVISAELRLGDGASAGTYHLNGGTLQALGPVPTGASIGTSSPGQLNIGNGRADISFLRLGQGAAGTINHSGNGELVVFNMFVGNTTPGTYLQSNAASRVTISSNLVIGNATPAGTYNLSNGEILVSGTTTNNGLFRQSGGRAFFQSVTGSGRMDILGSASLTVNRIRQARLDIADNARIFTRPDGGPDGTSVVKELFFETSEFNVDGRWDLNNNHLVVDHSPAAGTTFYNAVKLYIQSGYNLGGWNGDGLNSSAAIAAASTPEKTGLGYARANQVFTTFPAEFVGQAVDDSSVLVRYTLLGDNNLDGTVNIGDFANLAANFNLPGDWVHGDYDYDAQVNIADFALLASNFNKSLVAGPGSRPGAVPEPSVGLILAGAGLLARRRR